MQEAIAWFVRRRDDDFTEDDQTALDRWLSTSDAHLAAFNRVTGLWQKTDQAAGRDVELEVGDVPLRLHRRHLPLAGAEGLDDLPRELVRAVASDRVTLIRLSDNAHAPLRILRPRHQLVDLVNKY